jgi:hypothetical protein
MLPLPPSQPESKPLIELLKKPRERSGRPPSSRCCGSACWWNGWRVVFPVVSLGDGVFQRWELALSLAKCTGCGAGFTVYPEGIYPRRQYQLDVVAQISAAVVVGREPAGQAAARAGASATSARRWVLWLAQLVAPGELITLASRLDPGCATVPGAPASPETDKGGCAARVLAALEQVGLALLARGIRCVERTGLGRLLGWQHRAHGDIYGPCVESRRFSTGMAPPSLAGPA